MAGEKIGQKVGAAVERYMREQGYTVRGFSSRYGYSETVMRRWLKGGITLSALEAISENLGVPLTMFLEDQSQ